MPDEPPSQMIRVPTPLVESVRELSRLHRQGRTKAVLEGIQRLVAAIDSGTDIDIDSVSKMISRLTERLDRMEAQQSDSSIDINLDRFALVVRNLDQRMEEVEDDVKSIALTIADLNVRVSDLEGVGDIGYAVTPLSELELSGDITADVEVTPRQQDQDDITTDALAIAEPQPPAPLTQSALARRLGCSDKAIEKHRRQGSKENFAVWSRARDPDNIAWTWEGAGGRGQPLRFVPLD